MRRVVVLILSFLLTGCIHKPPDWIEHHTSDEYIGEGISSDPAKAKALAIQDVKQQIAERIYSSIQYKSHIKYTEKDVIVNEIINEYSEFIAENLRREDSYLRKLSGNRWIYYVLYRFPEYDLQRVRELILDNQKEIADRIENLLDRMGYLINKEDAWSEMQEDYEQIKALSQRLFIPNSEAYVLNARSLVDKFIENRLSILLTSLADFVKRNNYEDFSATYEEYKIWIDKLNFANKRVWKVKGQDLFISLLDKILNAKLDTLNQYASLGDWEQLFEYYKSYREFVDTLSQMDTESWDSKAVAIVEDFLQGINLTWNYENRSIHLEVVSNNVPLRGVSIEITSENIEPGINEIVRTDEQGVAAIEIPQGTVIEGQGVINCVLLLNPPIEFTFDTIKIILKQGGVSVSAYVTDYDYSKFSLVDVIGLKAVRLLLNIQSTSETPVLLKHIEIYTSNTIIAQIKDAINLNPSKKYSITVDIVDKKAYGWKFLRKIPPFPEPSSDWYYKFNYRLTNLLGYLEDVDHVNFDIFTEIELRDGLILKNSSRATLYLK